MKPRLSAMGLILLTFSAASANDLTVAQLLAHPREFAGKRVSVTGFYVAANEESNLFTTREAAKREDIDHSIWVEFRGISDARPAVIDMFVLLARFTIGLCPRPQLEKGADTVSTVYLHLSSTSLHSPCLGDGIPCT